MPDLRSPSVWAAASTSAASSSVASSGTARTGARSAPASHQVAAFNRLGHAEAVELVRPCLEVERWWSTTVDLRPYADLEHLLQVARAAADPLTRTELDLALGAHLGARGDDWLPVPDVDRFGATAALAVLHGRIAEDARAYLDRFGRPFVIRTSGRSVSEVAAHLERRLGHDTATEDRVVASVLRQIGLLTLVRRMESRTA